MLCLFTFLLCVFFFSSSEFAASLSSSLPAVVPYVTMSFFFFFLSFYILNSVHGVEVTPNSDCASFCLPSPNLDPSLDLSSTTQTRDLVCNDWELDGPNSTRVGRLFHDCLQCESNSTAVDKSTKENDVYWFLCKLCAYSSARY